MTESFIAKWEAHEVTFPLANTDVIVAHTLPQPFLSHRVRFTQDDATVGGIVYRSTRSAGPDYIVLRATVAGRYRILLFLEAYDESLQGV